MKNWLLNLLILFSLGLCVLLAVQWHREDVLRRQLQRSDKTANSVSETIGSLQSDIARLEAQTARAEGLRLQMSTNAAARELEVQALKAALAKANTNIELQNEALKKLAEERSEVAERYNQLAEDYNDLVNRWNAQQAVLTNAVRVLQ
jgi:predicted  nucleic acid-binding Zn-ribbon protein